MLQHGRTLLTLLVWVQFYISTTLAQNAWTTLASLPQYTLQEQSTVTLPNARIATVGGLINIGTWGTTTDLFQIYSIQSNTWSQGARLPVALNHPNAATVNGRVYLLGGLRGDSGWPATAGAWSYNPQTNAWSALPSMPSAQARGAAAVGVHNNIVYLAGGIPSLNSRSVRTVSAFNTATNQWVALPAAAQNIPEPRDHVGGAVVGGKFYVVGGRDSGIANVKSSVYVLDLQNLSAGWTTAPQMPTARAGHSIAASGTRIFTFGGEGNPAPGSSGVFPQVEVFDTATNAWTRLANMPTPRHGTAAAEVNGNIYIPGGGIVEGVGATSHVSSFSVGSGPGPQPPTPNPPTPTPQPPVPPPTNCAGLWGQCGGQGWSGPTCCSQGTCRAQNQWYSQCLQ